MARLVPAKRPAAAKAEAQIRWCEPVACAQYYACGLLWTNDDRLLQASHGLAHNILK
jgi:hypothetical protein